MRKVLLCVVCFLMILLTACGAENDALQSTIDEQADLIAQLEQTIAEQEAELQEQQAAHADAQQPDTLSMWHGYTEAEVRERFFQDAEHLVRQAVGEVRMDGGALQEEDVALIITANFVYALVSPNLGGFRQTLVILSYWRDWDNSDETVWAVLGYGTPFFNDPMEDREHPFIRPAHIIAPRPAAEARALTDLESVSLPFWPWPGYWDSPDPVYETIAGEHLWEEAIRLVREYYDVQIRDIWYEGRILYVEMMPIMAGAFNLGLGSWFHGDSVRQTFEAFPDADEVRFLVLGRRFTAGYNGYDINSICGGWSAAMETGDSTCTCIW